MDIILRVRASAKSSKVINVEMLYDSNQTPPAGKSSVFQGSMFPYAIDVRRFPAVIKIGCGGLGSLIQSQHTEGESSIVRNV